MGILGLWAGVLRVIFRRRRGAYGRFYRGIPGFSGDARARRGDSAHGGQWRRDWAKKFLKRGGKPKNWGTRGAERRCRGTLYRVCEVIFRRAF